MSDSAGPLSAQKRRSGTRLIWRGSIATENGQKLHGLAIIAHGDATSSPSKSGAVADRSEANRVVATPRSSLATLRRPCDRISVTPQVSPPLASSSQTARSYVPTNASPRLAKAVPLSELSLDLEMLRHTTLQVHQVVALGEPTAEEREAVRQAEAGRNKRKDSKRRQLSALIKGKSRQLQEDSQSARIISLTQESMGMYIDPRCPDTVAWFEDRLCRQELIAGEHTTRRGIVLLLGNALTPDLSSKFVIYGQAIDADELASQQPKLQLKLGREIEAKARLPRPDDPLPRESALTMKLRQAGTESLNVQKSAQKSNGKSAQRGIPTDDDIFMSKAGSPQRSLLPTMRDPNVMPIKARLNNTKGAKTLIQPSLAAFVSKPVSRSLPTDRVASNGMVHRKRSRSCLEPHDDIKPGFATLEARERKRSRSISRALSPLDIASQQIRRSHSQTPSILPPSRSQSTIPPDKIKRESSHSLAVHPDRHSREPSVQVTTLEGRNRASLKKLIVNALADRNIKRDHPEFEAYFSVVLNSLKFALRATLSTETLDKIQARSLIDAHLAMYLVTKTRAFFSFARQCMTDSSGVYTDFDARLTNTAASVQDATLTIRVIKSFAYRSTKNLILHHVDLTSTTVGQLKARVILDIQTAPGFKPYRNAKLDTLKLYTKAHGAKTTNLIINMDNDEWILDDDGATLATMGLENETEVSFFGREDYEAFKKDPETKWI
ncbi:hypothetical protein E5Q_02726 [Mixia osmundae IAM 14324]|uniref:Sld7 C-terminal domain-containing protein n=1 Tax=Mixia osmundae (strain CBS 9802 / IAM 14324 / JCM 22182 / KY 12970) TaxID=764103 RepID=G7DZQ5_MIXOS|nr:hypothetical protein E5Q_02726 [Mixia osmundae IAM 14324]